MAQRSFLFLPILIVFISGCTFIRAVTFNEYEGYSHQIKGSNASLDVYISSEKNPCRPDQTGQKMAVAAIAAAAAVTIAINIAESEIASYLEKKQKEFTANYSANVNLAYDAKDPPVCLRLTRYIEGDEDPVLTWIGSLVTEEHGDDKTNKALQIKTVALELKKSAALTDEESKSIDLEIETKLDVLAKNEKNVQKLETTAHKVLSYSGLKIGNSINCIDKSSKKDNEKYCEIMTSWIPSIKEGSFVNIAVKATETGSGGDSFGALGKQIDDNKKTFNDAVSEIITEALD